jgi:hypothetical protein
MPQSPKRIDMPGHPQHHPANVSMETRNIGRDVFACDDQVFCEDGFVERERGFGLFLASRLLSLFFLRPLLKRGVPVRLRAL